MNAVIDAVRKKYPAYANVPDDELTRKIGDKYPQYLKDEGFAADYSRLIDTSGFTAPAEKPGFLRNVSTDLPPDSNVTPEVTESTGKIQIGITPPPGQPDLVLQPGGMIDPGDPKEGAFTQALFKEAPGAAMTYVGNVARGAIADASVGLSTLADTKKEAIQKSVEYSGNLPAALKGEPLPIDRALGESALEEVREGGFPALATTGQVSQGLAAMAPLAAIGLAPAAIQRLAALGFSIDMVMHAPELFKDYAEEINKPKEEQDPDKIAKLTSGIMQTFAFAPLAGKHGVGRGPAGKLNPELELSRKTGIAPVDFLESAKAELPNELITISQQKSPEVLRLERANAPLTAKAVEATMPKVEEPPKPLDTLTEKGQGGEVKGQNENRDTQSIPESTTGAGEPSVAQAPISQGTELQTKAAPKFKLTFQQFLDAPREGELLDALRTLPRSEKTPAELEANAKYEQASEAVNKAGLAWIFDRATPSKKQMVETSIRRLPKTKKKIVDEYEAALEETIKASTGSREARQRNLYDKAVEAGLIENPQAAVESPSPSPNPRTPGSPSKETSLTTEASSKVGEQIVPAKISEASKKLKEAGDKADRENIEKHGGPEKYIRNQEVLLERAIAAGNKNVIANKQKNIARAKELYSDTAKPQELIGMGGAIPAEKVEVKLTPKVTSSNEGVQRIDYFDASGNRVGYGQLDGRVINYIEVVEGRRGAGIGAAIARDLASRGGKVGITTSPESAAMMRSAGAKEIGGKDRYEFLESSEKVRVGKNPTPHTVVEKLPQTREVPASEKVKTPDPNKFQKGEVVNTSKYGQGKVVADMGKRVKVDFGDGNRFAVDRADLTRAKPKGGETAGALTPAPLAPGTPSPSTPISVKSQRQMITDLSKALKLPIRFGRLTTNKYAGYFKRVADLIGIKKASDVPTTAHEAGHKMDQMFGLSKDSSIAAELDKLGDPATPGSASSWTPSKTKDYKMGEGVAEFVRYFLTDPAKAKLDAPNTFTAFEKILDANKDLGDALRQTQEDIHIWKTAPPQSRLRAQVSIGENPNRTRYTLSQLTRDILDDLHILNRATKDAGDLPPSQDPYMAARNLRGSYGMAETFINKGIVDFKSKSVDLGTSLEHALKPVAEKLNNFRDWMVAKRAQELHKQGRETGIVASDADAVAAMFDKDPVFQKAFDDIKKWNDALLDYAVDAGLVSKTSAEAMRKMNQDYVPFHRIFEVGAGEFPSEGGIGVGMGLNVGKPGSLKSMTGSTRQIVDPLETMVKNAYAIVTAAEKAAINKSVAGLSEKPGMGKWVEKVAVPKEQVRVELDRIRKQLEKAGADLTKVPDDLLLSFFRGSNKTPFGENVIKVIKNGESEFYRLDSDLHDTFKALDLEDAGTILKILSSPAQLLRSGVVLEPAFNLANAWRDAFSSAIISRHGTLPFEAMIRGFAAMIGNKKLVAEWAASGGKSAVEPAFFDRKKMQQYMAEKISKNLTPAEKATIVVRSPLTALRVLSGAFEEATRIGEYQKAFNDLTKKGMPAGEARRLAAFESRDRQDFAMGGAKTGWIRRMAPFWNAAMQGNYRLFKSFRERPFATTAKGLAYITTLKMAEQAMNWNDEDYWDRPQWERDAFFMIPNGKDESGHTKFIRLPIPFLPGVMFATVPGRIMQYAKTHDPKAGEGVAKMFLKEIFPKPQWPIGSAISENFLTGPRGWDSFRGRQVVPERLIDLPPELQFTEQTSRAAKKIGEVLGISPIKIDHFIEQTTGGMGKLLSGKQRFGQRFQTAPLNVSSEVEAEFYRLLEEEQSLQAQGKPSAGIAGVYAGLISTLRKAEREAKTEKEKEEYREQIFQLEKQAVNEVPLSPTPTNSTILQLRR